MGTLGVITQLTLKVRPAPRSLGAGLDRMSRTPTRSTPCSAAFDTSSARPVAIELLNPAASWIMGGASGDPAGSWILAVGLEGADDSVAWQVDRLGQGTWRAGFRGLPRRRGGAPLVGLDRVPGGRAPGRSPASPTCGRRGSPRSSEAWTPSAGPSRRTPATASSGCRGLGDWTEERAALAIDAHRATAVRDGGNLIVTRCPTAWKDRLRVWGEPRADWALARNVKRALDPRGLMNPGRFVTTSDTEFALRGIVR